MGLPPPDEELAARRERMVATQISARGIRDARVLEAMRRVERHRFVPHRDRDLAYGDHPIGIGCGQTISQPYIVGFMTEALALAPDARVLEIGTGSAYQTAVLAEVAREVFSIEVVREHADRATELLRELGYSNAHVRLGDGYLGWPEAAPFDGIIVTAAAEHVPPPLVEQLTIGGRLVVPIGRAEQDLLVLTRTADGLHEEERLAVRFVPLVRARAGADDAEEDR
jgi:protein-L-isoaspartate(D-aspartate) O-methyltransferase